MVFKSHLGPPFVCTFVSFFVLLFPTVCARYLIVKAHPFLLIYVDNKKNMFCQFLCFFLPFASNMKRTTDLFAQERWGWMTFFIQTNYILADENETFQTETFSLLILENEYFCFQAQKYNLS